MAARRPLIAGNWKMHGTRAEAARLLSALKAQVSGLSDREVVVAPPFTALETAARVLTGSPVSLAAQNLHWEPQGAFTGEVSGPMLKELGCSYVIIGHSERRQYFAETDEHVARKVKAAQRNGLVPIMCVGETLEEHERGETLGVIKRQIQGGLQGQGKAAIAALVIAYEPVWAIGTGRTATPDQAQEVHAAIRATLATMTDQPTADAVRILYGGSVKADNVDGLMAQADIDGALVGGASLQAESFARIVHFR
jgi:triosephosphate isomerase (TIM)